MKKNASFLILFFFTISAFSAVSNFSGTWKLNKSKSTLNSEFSMAPTQIVISQAETTFDVTRHSNFQGQDYTMTDKFTLDGKECINPGWMDTEKKSTVNCSEDGKILTIKHKIPMQDGGEMTISEIYQFVEGGLKVTVAASSSFGDLNETYIFEK